MRVISHPCTNSECGFRNQSGIFFSEYMSHVTHIQSRLFELNILPACSFNFFLSLDLNPIQIIRRMKPSTGSYVGWDHLLCSLHGGLWVYFAIPNFSLVHHIKQLNLICLVELYMLRKIVNNVAVHGPRHTNDVLNEQMYRLVLIAHRSTMQTAATTTANSGKTNVPVVCV